MKKSVKVTFVVVCVLLLATGVVYARNTLQALPGSGWSTGIQVQNVGSGVAQIVLTGYDAAGAATYTDSTTGANTAVGESRNYTTFPSGPSSFNGAGVFSSDQPIVAIVNINNGSSGGLAAGQYQGVDATKTGTQIRFPLVKNGNGSKCTTFFVQNAGSSADKIYATFSNGSTWNSGTAVDPGDMVTIDPANATPAVPTSGNFALTVTSTQSLAGTVSEYICTGNTVLQATRGFGSSDGDSTLLVPIYKHFLGTPTRSTGIQVQNVGASAATITVTYACATCSLVQYQQSVPAGASVTFFKNNIIAASGGGATGSTGTALANGTLAAATVTSDGSVVAIVNESYDTVPAGYNQSATTYSAQPMNAAAVKLGVPLAKEKFNNKTTGIQIQNAGGSAATVKVTYVLNAGAAACQGTYIAQNINVDPGKSVTLNALSGGGAVPGGGSWSGGNAIKAGCFGGATVESTNGVKLVAIVNEADINPNPALQQDKKNYEAFPIQ
jgi:hypothetical protein